MNDHLARGGPSVVLILDRDRDRATESAKAFAAPDRLLLTGGDAVVGPLVGRRLPLGTMVTEAQIAGRFTFDGLDAIAGVHQAAPRCRIVVTGENLPDGVTDEAVRRGATDVLLRPFAPSEFRT